MFPATLVYANEATVALAVTQKFCAAAATGALGITKGTALPEPAEEGHPFTVCTTVKVVLLEVVVEEDVPPSLQSIVAFAAGVNTSVDNPQALVTLTEGVAGVVFGAATPEPEAEVHPFAVCVTVYVPAVETVIGEVVSVVLHNKVPVAVVLNVLVPLQLFTTVTTGALGMAFTVMVTTFELAEVQTPLVTTAL